MIPFQTEYSIEPINMAPFLCVRHIQIPLYKKFKCMWQPVGNKIRGLFWETKKKLKISSNSLQNNRDW